MDKKNRERTDELLSKELKSLRRLIMEETLKELAKEVQKFKLNSKVQLEH